MFDGNVGSAIAKGFPRRPRCTETIKTIGVVQDVGGVRSGCTPINAGMYTKFNFLLRSYFDRTSIVQKNKQVKSKFIPNCT
jgi:hypothetical protein